MDDAVLFLDLCGQAEVGQLQRGLFSGVREQKVFRLEIPVHDAVLVAPLHPEAHLAEHAGSVLLSERAHLLDDSHQLVACAVLHDKVEVLLVLVCFMEVHLQRGCEPPNGEHSCTTTAHTTLGCPTNLAINSTSVRMCSRSFSAA